MSQESNQEQMQHFIASVKAYNEQAANQTGQSKKACIHSYGCQQNVSDGERIAGILAEMGYSFTDQVEDADFVLYNTCAVREGAEDRVFGNVGALKNAKRRNPSMIIGLCGCMTQQEHVAKRIRTSFPFVDILFGSGAMHRLPELLFQKLTTGKHSYETLDPTMPIEEDLPVRRDGTIRAWLPIMYGCDNFCTYCVVPLVRGRERSREPEKILAEARELIAAGFREITLLGQNVNSYGKGLETPMNFAGLLRELCALPGDFKLRFMTSHPKDCTRELIDTMAAEEKIHNHLHLPVQSGSDRILRAMNRRYTAAQYLDLIRYAKEKMPDLTLTSDIIVGFPGETGEEFQQTLDLVREAGYLSMFTFIFSPRPGTKAADMPDNIPSEEKSRRFEELLALQNELTGRIHEQQVGEVQRVLVDGYAKTPDMLSGRNRSNMVVNLSGPPELIGNYAKVKITKAAHWSLVGEAIE